ncbi:hypothetical protein ACE38V_12755 [Cytobacillus sp. Hz8]|uniref:hypothetical protein n=1 Tax=Cytobacillus sp. Hz8 TaxID=3347168 RepID=UPI0035E09F79
MEDEFLTGYLTIDPGVEMVWLMHKVHGRYSSLELAEGDRIEVNDGNGYKEVDFLEVLDSFLSDSREKAFRLISRQSIGGATYEGVKARVKINPRATKRIKQNHQRRIFNYLFYSVRERVISQDEAMDIFFKSDIDKDD